MIREPPRKWLGLRERGRGGLIGRPLTGYVQRFGGKRYRARLQGVVVEEEKEGMPELRLR